MQHSKNGGLTHIRNKVMVIIIGNVLMIMALVGCGSGNDDIITKQNVTLTESTDSKTNSEQEDTLKDEVDTSSTDEEPIEENKNVKSDKKEIMIDEDKADAEQSEDSATDKDAESEESKEKSTEDKPVAQLPGIEEMPNEVKTEFRNKGEEQFATDVKSKTFINEFGIQVIEKVYTLPYDVSIYDVAPYNLVEQNIQYAVSEIIKPRQYADKELTKEQVAETEAEAGEFPESIEYDDTDGSGLLTLAPETVKVEINNTEKNPYSVSTTKHYDMEIKNYDNIPQTISHKGGTLYLGNVTWQDMGDSGAGINDTPDKDAYGTYNTVASSWRAIASYSATRTNVKNDYKGSAIYKGKILIKDSPVYQYTVTYTPDTLVSNVSGNYYNAYQDSISNRASQQLDVSNQRFTQDMFMQRNKDQTEFEREKLQADYEQTLIEHEIGKEMNKIGDEVISTPIKVGFIIVIAILLLALVLIGIIAFRIFRTLSKDKKAEMAAQELAFDDNEDEYIYEDEDGKIDVEEIELIDVEEFDMTDAEDTEDMQETEDVEDIEDTESEETTLDEEEKY